ncbi:hypothetical protein [Ferruginibacter profundus]
MNTQNKSLFTSISKSETKALTTIVKETLAFGLVNQEKHFTAADLWNIQRQKRSTQRRHFA